MSIKIDSRASIQSMEEFGAATADALDQAAAVPKRGCEFITDFVQRTAVEIGSSTGTLHAIQGQRADCVVLGQATTELVGVIDELPFDDLADITERLRIVTLSLVS